MSPEIQQALVALITALVGYVIRHFDLFKMHGTPATPGPAPAPGQPSSPANGSPTPATPPARPILSALEQVLLSIISHPTATPEAKGAAVQQVLTTAGPLTKSP